jgi:NTE family protein
MDRPVLRIDLGLQGGGARGAFMIALLNKVARPVDDEGARWTNMRTHRVTSDIMLDLGPSSKLNAEWPFLRLLRDRGRSAADDVLQRHADDLGERSSFDLAALLDGV